MDAARHSSRAATTSLVVGSAVFAAKSIAWWLTGSAAILSDALESVVNVVAAAFAVYAVRVAARPADRDHPYGHGKIEYLSAAFEGGLVFFAAITTLYAAVRALLSKAEVRAVDLGAVLAGGAALVNLLLGAWLLRIGKRVRSPTLIADGHHVLSDVWTTVGAIVGLFAARLTGLRALDPIVALALAVLLARTGGKLVLSSADGLMDREDPELLARLVDAFRAADVPGVTGVHRLRAIRHGASVHVDVHAYVPAEWTVSRAHDAARELERRVQEKSGLVGEIVVHLDPRREGEAERPPISIDDATRDA